MCLKCGNEIKEGEQQCSVCGAEVGHGDDVDILQNGTFLKDRKYRIEKKIGQGGFGITYLATRLSDNAAVVIKEFFYSAYCRRDPKTHTTIIISGGQSNAISFNKAKERAKKEARALTVINHPNIVKAYEEFEENNTVYIAMEYIEGIELRALIKEKKRLSQEEAIAYFKQLLQGLQALHTIGMVHRDIKPQNILITKDNTVKLIDFGTIADIDEKSREITNIQSQGYAPKEINYKHTTIQPRYDIYSAGMALYSMLSGKVDNLPTPLDRENIDSIKIAIEKELSLPKKLQEVLLKCVAIEPEERYQSVEEILKELGVDDSIIGGSTGGGGEEIPTSPSSKAGYIAVALVVLGIIGGWLFVNNGNHDSPEKKYSITVENEENQQKSIVHENTQNSGTYTIKQEIQQQEDRKVSKEDTSKLVDNGKEMLKKKQYDAALKLFDRACDLGDALGCNWVGYMYYNGIGVVQNYQKAEKYYSKAIDGKEYDNSSLLNLGKMYRDGKGVVKDINKAIKMFSKACQQDNKEGCREADRIKLKEEYTNIYSVDLIKLSKPLFTYFSKQKASNKSLKLIQESVYENRIVDTEEWFRKNRLDYPKIDARKLDMFYKKIRLPKHYYNTNLLEVYSDENYIYLLYGKNYLKRRYLFIVSLKDKKFLYGFDFINYAYATSNINDFVYQQIIYAKIVDHVLYFSTAHSTYSKDSSGKNAYMNAFDLKTMQLIWQSKPLVSNSDNFVIYKNWIITGYGFTREKDYLYVLDKKSGKILNKYPIKTRSEYLIYKDSKLFVRTYNKDYIFRLFLNERKKR